MNEHEHTYCPHCKPCRRAARMVELEDALRSLASWLGNGGYNADGDFNVSDFEAKIRAGVDSIIKVEVERAVSQCHKSVHWVATSERLPPTGYAVLVSGDGWQNVAAHFGERSDVGWLSCQDGLELKRPTHWMLLPDAPIQPHKPGGEIVEDTRITYIRNQHAKAKPQPWHHGEAPAPTWEDVGVLLAALDGRNAGWCKGCTPDNCPGGCNAPPSAGSSES